VEGRADGEHDGALGSGFFAEFGGALYSGLAAGDDGLVGGVHIGGRDDEFVGGDVGADFEDLGDGEAEDGGHCALAGGNGGLHELAAEPDGTDGVGEGESVGGNVCGVLAQGVAGGEGDGEIAGFEFRLEDAEGGDGDGEDGGLGVLGELEGVFGAVEDEVGEREAEGVVGLFKDGPGGGAGVVEGAAHADSLGALAGEEEGDGGGLRGGCFSAHQDSLAASGGWAGRRRDCGRLLANFVTVGYSMMPVTNVCSAWAVMRR
jgi:hypothetical protein